MKKFGILILAALAGGSWMRAQDRPMERIFVSLSQPDRPGTLVIKHDKGSISVLGYEGNEVIVEATRRPPQTSGEVDRDAQGMTRVPAAAIQISARELNNTVTVISNSRDETLDLNVKVPRRFSLHLGTIHNGRIVVRNVEGEFEISNTNGDIQLEATSVRGGIETTNGDVRIGAGSRVEGGIHVEKPGGWGWNKPKTLPRITVESGAVVDGALRFDREVELAVAADVTIGPIEGVAPRRVP